MRLLIALALGALVAVPVWDAMAQDARDDPAPGTPGAMRLPAPGVGDRGAYTVSTVRLVGDAVEDLPRPAPRLERIEFQWNASRWTLDGQGHARAVNTLSYVLNWTNATGDSEVFASERLLDPATGEVVARVGLDAFLGAPGLNGGSDPDAVQVYNTGRTYAFAVPEVAAEEMGLCGLRNALQGHTVEVQEPFALFPTCTLDPCGLHPQHFCRPTPLPLFRAVAVDALGEERAVRFAADWEGRAVRAWFTEDRAYPYRLAVEDATQPGVFELYQLVAEGKGRGLLGRPGGSAPEEPPGLEFAERKAWGPDDTGVTGHPFLLSEAWEVAVAEDTTLQALLEEHPDAYVVSATYFDGATDDRHAWVWVLGVTDGTKVVSTAVLRETRSLLADSPLPLPGPLARLGMQLSNTTTTHVMGNGGEAGAVPKLPLPSQLPAELPTVASMMARWQGFHEVLGDRDVASRTWGFVALCTSDDCGEVTYMMGVGEGSMSFLRGLTYPVVPEDVASAFDFNQLTVTNHDQALFFREGHAGFNYSLPLDLVQLPGAAPAPLVTAAMLSVPVAPLLPEHLALAAGLGALVAAVLYVVWPVLKNGAVVGLYSRMPKSLVLKNEVRARMMQVIRENPGIGYLALAQRLGLHEGKQNRHHIDRLVWAGLVVERSEPGFKHVSYFAAGEVEPRVREVLAVLKSEGARRVVDVVAAEPGLRMGEVAERAGLRTPSVTYHVQRLAAKEALLAVRSGREVRLELTDLGYEAIGKRRTAGLGTPGEGRSAAA